MNDNQVLVRMYNVGFGDCFLVRLPTSDGPKRILIDCGTHPASTGPRQARRDAMPQLFADLEQEAGGRRVDVVVATHRHKDHISAFAAPEWKDFQTKEVWMPWTEDPNDPVATRIRERMKLALVGLLNARQGLRALGEPAAAVGARMAVASDLIDNNDEFVDDDIADEFGLAIKNERSMQTLWSGFAGNPKREYLSIERDIIETPALPGVKIHILGPSRDEAVIRDLDPPPAETFAHLDDPERLTASPQLPFEDGWARSMADVAGNTAFSHLRVSGQIVGTIRQLAADDLLAAAAGIESSINGTSLMLVIEVGGLFLFFPGDAQWGTWDMVLDNPQARSLLQKVSFYKIGHHGSHNATPRTFIKEVMAANALAAVPVAPVKVWPRIPLEDLVTEMRTLKQIRLVRSDIPNADGPIANVTVRDNISVDFAFDVPDAQPTRRRRAPRSTTAPRRNGGRKVAAEVERHG